MNALFGTDGIRGPANTLPMTAEVALRVGMAAGEYFRTAHHRRHQVVIAKDTRLSGYMLESALTAGFTAAGMDVILVGPLPTPAVAMLTRSLRADAGVMISASHNPYEDNGIKLFGPDGFKLSDAVESAIADKVESGIVLPPASGIGRAKRLDDARGRYIEFAKTTFPRSMRLSGMKVVLDCAHGAAYHVGPIILWELGAEVIPLGVAPDGTNINANCGSTHPQALQQAVRDHNADVGIALDGDADRAILVDERGEVLDGDQLMAMVAMHLQETEQLRGGGIVATQMSNLGLERFLTGRGLHLHRAAVGDRYVVEAMRTHGYNVGGEQSGHVILTDYTTTGDGLIAALQALAVLKASGKPLSVTGRMFSPVPQLLRNVRYAAGENPLEQPAVQVAITQGTKRLEGNGRLFVRRSGTEPLVRVMAESEDDVLMTEVVHDVIAAIAHTSETARVK